MTAIGNVTRLTWRWALVPAELLLSGWLVVWHFNQGALKVLTKYYGELMDEIAADILRNKEEFEKGAFGRAEEIVSK